MVGLISAKTAFLWLPLREPIVSWVRHKPGNTWLRVNTLEPYPSLERCPERTQGLEYFLHVTALIKFNQPQWQEPNHSYCESSPLIANPETTPRNFKESFSARASWRLSACLSFFSFLPFSLSVSKRIKKSSHPQPSHAPKTTTWVCLIWHFPFFVQNKNKNRQKQKTNPASCWC